MRRNTSWRYNNSLRESGSLEDEYELNSAFQSLNSRLRKECIKQNKKIEDSYNGKYKISIVDPDGSINVSKAVVFKNTRNSNFYAIVRGKSLYKSGISIRFSQGMPASNPKDIKDFYLNSDVEIDSKQIEEMLSVAKEVKRCMDTAHEVKGKEDWDEYKDFEKYARKTGYLE